MRVQPITGTSFFGPEQAYTSVTAALAEMRKVWQQSAPGVSWDVVHAEASRVRAQQPMTLLEALRVVHQRMTTGVWDPNTAR